MHRAVPPLVSNHRLARILSWAGLWLAWVARVVARFAPVLPAAFERNVRAHLDRCADIVARVIFLRAVARLDRRLVIDKKQGPPRRAGSRRSASMRVLIGAALRRALRGKDFCAKLAALADVVRDAELHIAKLAIRLARGLTRRRLFALAPEFAPLALAASYGEAICADTS